MFTKKRDIIFETQKFDNRTFQIYHDVIKFVDFLKLFLIFRWAP